MDPFDVFGGEVDEDDGDETDEKGHGMSWNAQVLVASANERLSRQISPQSHPSLPSPQSLDVETNQLVKEESDANIILNFETLDISSWKPPLYLGPIQLVTSLAVGGGRGYVASQDLEPGTLIMVDAPVIGWPPEQIGQPLDLVSVEHILESPGAETIVHMMEELHPTKQTVDQFNDDDTDETNSIQVGAMMKELQSQYQDDARPNHLIELCVHRHIRNSDGSAVSEKDVFRLLLALRYNGLESGIYCHTSMLNHDCFPNCVKFLPDTSSASTYPEVRTTRGVRAGESLTISYISQIRCHASRRRHLWDQHRFDIGVDYLKGKHRQMELIGNKLPPSRLDMTLDENSTTHRIEMATDELETLYQESLQAMEYNKSIQDDELAEQIKALEMSCLELCREAQAQLQNDRHVLLLACLRLHLDTCELVQKVASLTSSQRLGVLCRQVVTAQRLVNLQKDYYGGDDHFDLASTHLDLANAIGEVLSKNPKLLFQLEAEPKTTFAAWSALEFQSRKEHERIRALYPHDAEERMEGNIPAIR